MTGITTTDGDIIIANMAFKNADVNRGSSLQLGLFTNASGLSKATVLASITEPTGGSYARKTLADASWTNTNGVATYAIQTFTASAAYTGSVYGYFIATTGTAPKLLAYEIDPVGPYTILTNDTYDITPSITIS